MRRLGHVTLAVLLMTALMGGAASADIEWCAEDPVVDVLGSQFRLTTLVHSPAADVRGIAYVLDVPSNAGQVGISYPGGSPIPTTVEVRYTGEAAEPGEDFGVRVSVTVSYAGRTEVLVRLDGRSVETATFAGRANKPIVFKVDVNR